MSPKKLSEQDFQKLKEYRLSDTADGHSVDFSSMLDPAQLPGILAWLTGRIGAPNACVTSSILIKRIGFYAVIHLYAMSALEKKLNVDIRGLKLVDQTDSNLWLPDFYFGDFDSEELGKDRDEWREWILTDVFARCLFPLIHLLKEQTRLSEKVMWENVAIYIHWIYGELMKDGEIEPRAKADYQYLFHKADGKLFGDYEENPLSPFARESGTERKTCCLSYMLKRKEKRTCSTCPLKEHISGLNEE